MALRFPVSTPNFRNSVSKPPFRPSPISKSSRTASEAHDVVQTFVRKGDSQKVAIKWQVSPSLRFRVLLRMKLRTNGVIYCSARIMRESSLRRLRGGLRHHGRGLHCRGQGLRHRPGELRRPKKTIVLL
jgi:hypothetical protein